MLSYMERRPCCSTLITNFFFLFLILTLPYFSRGGSRAEVLDSEIYEIDYRGPETHSRVPPPGHSHGKSYSPHHPKSSVAAAQEAMGLTGTHAIMKQKVKKVHG